MTNMLSDQAREFLREDHVAVVSTLNKDGSPHVTTIYYLLANDGTLVMTTPVRSQKAKISIVIPASRSVLERGGVLSASMDTFPSSKTRRSSGKISNA